MIMTRPGRRKNIVKDDMKGVAVREEHAKDRLIWNQTVL